ncbi:D-isomer-specific 2-hydroxyacid dehydrogenase family protein [Xylariaceae sp. FL1272]|nr:D-isomer-specific 2-hydroxyacid dehydrogenase family protein [Xylariaceae sp. FL1272]
MATPQTHWIIAALETFWCPLPNFTLPEGHTFELREYSLTSMDQIAERIHDVDIIVSTVLPLKPEVLESTVSPRLKMISIIAVGTDHVDMVGGKRILNKNICRSRGIVVSNTPHCNETSEHALALYFATRRSIVSTHLLNRAGDWPAKRSQLGVMRTPDDVAPRTCRDEIVGIVGYGAIGKLAEATFSKLGMKIIIAGRKGDTTTVTGRVPFETAVRECSVLIISCPRAPSTLNLISDAEFNMMKPYSLLINVSRGGIVDESALVSALKEGKIAGAATDVYAVEPSSPSNSPLLAEDTKEDTQDKYRAAAMANVAAFVTQGNAKYQVR